MRYMTSALHDCLSPSVLFNDVLCTSPVPLSPVSLTIILPVEHASDVTFGQCSEGMPSSRSAAVSAARSGSMI